MLYLFCGSDQKKSLTNFKKLADSLVAKKPGVLVFKMDNENFSPSLLEEIIFSSSLFDPKYLIILKNLTSSLEGRDFMEKHLKDLAETSHIILVLEGVLTKPLLNLFNKHAEKVQIYDSSAKKEVGFNIFSIADAFGQRDKKKLWVLFQEALFSGITAEEVFWRLVGQVKNMLIVGQTENIKSIKIHPFVLQKTISANKNFSLTELKSLYREFLDIYSDARSGKREFEISLERLILSL